LDPDASKEFYGVLVQENSARPIEVAFRKSQFTTTEGKEAEKEQERV
jgi:hypothetical protein